MRNKLILAVLVLAAGVSDAGERKWLGRLTSAGSHVTNSSTAVPFVIPLAAKLTIQCDAAARLLTDASAVATTIDGGFLGFPVSANTPLLTSVAAVDSTNTTISSTASALITVVSESGTVNCDVWQREGDE